MASNLYREAIQEPRDRVIVALDGMGWGQAKEIMTEVKPYVGMVQANSLAQKIGWDRAILDLEAFGVQTLADTNYKASPSGMKGQLAAISECLPRFVTVCADNDQLAMEAAVEGRNITLAAMLERPEDYNLGTDNEDEIRHRLARVGGILGVTVLSSLSSEDCLEIYGAPFKAKVLQFVHKIKEAGLDGVICTGLELQMIRSCPPFRSLLTVVTGVLPEWARDKDCPSGTLTPAEALAEGADYLLIGRAITDPPKGVSPAEAASRIVEEIRTAAPGYPG